MRIVQLRFATALASLVLAIACGDGKGQPVSTVTGPTPDTFRVSFETTRGNFAIVAYHAWSPIGVDRLYQLASAGLLDDNGFFRVVPRFIVQFGAIGDPKVNAHWDSLRIADDPRVEKNRLGTIAFAKEGPETRSHQLFINLADSPHLDRDGFVPIGRVVEGMGVVQAIYSDYREKPDYQLIATVGNSYLHRMFPKLDYIKTARVVR